VILGTKKMTISYNLAIKALMSRYKVFGVDFLSITGPSASALQLMACLVNGEYYYNFFYLPSG
jgi:hypothetical protein